MQSRAGAVNVASVQGKPMFYLGRPAIRLESNPAREGRLRWQESAEAIVPGNYREGLNNKKDEYDEQFAGRTWKTETLG